MTSMTEDELIAMMGVVVRTGCRRMTSSQLAALSESVTHTESMLAKPWWDRKAVAHAEAIVIIGDLTSDPTLTRVADLAAGWTYDLAIAAGPVVDGVILASRRRLLFHFRARDPDAAEHEIERHLRVLRFMGQLSGRGKPDRSLFHPDQLELSTTSAKLAL